MIFSHRGLDCVQHLAQHLRLNRKKNIRTGLDQLLLIGASLNAVFLKLLQLCAVLIKGKQLNIGIARRNIFL